MVVAPIPSERLSTVDKECADPDCPKHVTDSRAHAEKLANVLFLKRTVLTMGVGALKMAALPLIRTVMVVAGALALHWSALPAFLLLLGWRSRKGFGPMWRNFRKGASRESVEPGEMSPAEAMEAVESRLRAVNAMPKQFSGWVLLAFTAFLCGVFGWDVSGNGGFAVLLFLCGAISPVLNTWAVRSSVKPIFQLVRFADPTRPRDTPEC